MKNKLEKIYIFFEIEKKTRKNKINQKNIYFFKKTLALVLVR
jgi:hypothetical protein